VSADDNVKTVQAVYEAFGRGDWSRSRDGKIAFYRGTEATAITAAVFAG